MSLRHLITCGLITLLAGTAAGQQVVVRAFASHVLEPAPHGGAPLAEDETRRISSSLQSYATAPPTFLVYPVAGTVGGDLAIPYYVDLDPSHAKLDYNCSDLTFNGHTGHDPYVRSFIEQEIGVPVFAVLDGVVVDVHDGEPDQNTDNDMSLKPNYVTIRHGDSLMTQYVHLRRGISVKVGDRVTAGTQIGLVGSSGPSVAPHVHFEARHNGVAYEPMSGPCDGGKSRFTEPPPMFSEPLLVSAAFSTESFDRSRPAPFDDVEHTGTFVRGLRTIYFKADLANIGATTRYALKLRAPGSTRDFTASSGILTKYDASLASIWWGLDADLRETGTWILTLVVNERHEFEVPFTVVNSAAEVRNRPPAPVTASLEPLALHPGQVAVCRAAHDGFPDPDFGIVRYRYEWRVDGAVVRDVTSAARSDALPRQFTRSGAEIACRVTASDGHLAAQPADAFTTVEWLRRRAVR